MPAIMTHDFFGQDAFGPALGALRMDTSDERDAFLLGNQGPDPLFYLMLTPPLKVFEELGSEMHHNSPTPLFLAFRRALDAMPENQKPVAKAYLAGFTCHYLLDRAIHPLVYYWQNGLCHAGVEGLDVTDGGNVHAEIERDLDEMVLYAKRNQTIEVYRPYVEVLRASKEVLTTIGELYYDALLSTMTDSDPSTKAVYPLAVACFRTAQRMFYSPREHKSKALARIEAPLLKKRYSLVRAMSHRVRAQSTSDFDNRDNLPWTNPFTEETSTESFWDLYDSTLLDVEPAIHSVLGDNFDRAAAESLTCGLNFSGEYMG
ncbi:MAG: hypothetical protein Q4B54_13915 [Coriobacteriales bacterium]|nr:hypothetical protein [Coriobacteriales bacterium]